MANILCKRIIRKWENGGKSGEMVGDWWEEVVKWVGFIDRIEVKKAFLHGWLIRIRKF